MPWLDVIGFLCLCWGIRLIHLSSGVRSLQMKFAFSLKLQAQYNRLMYYDMPLLYHDSFKFLSMGIISHLFYTWKLSSFKMFSFVPQSIWLSFPPPTNPSKFKFLFVINCVYIHELALDYISVRYKWQSGNMCNRINDSVSKRTIGKWQAFEHKPVWLKVTR